MGVFSSVGNVCSLSMQGLILFDLGVLVSDDVFPEYAGIDLLYRLFHRLILSVP